MLNRMNPVNPIFALLSLFTAMLPVILFIRFFGVPTTQGRFATIDGLRGYLAFFVFQCHASIWYFYLRTGKWEVPPSNLYTNFGQGGVSLFFMITAFLFFSKLLDSRNTHIDWLRLYVSRALRLIPLYFFAMMLTFMAVAYLSGFTLREPWMLVLKETSSWLSFTILGNPNINGESLVSIMGVVWSLPYEWFFYFSLPLFALMLRLRTPIFYVIFSLCAVTIFYFQKREWVYLACFCSGIATSVIVRHPLASQLATTKPATMIALLCLFIAILYFPSAYKTIPLLLLSVTFVINACGNSLFGLLTLPQSKALGELSYSLYLLHSLVLFFAFHIIFPKSASLLSASQHWSVVAIASPILIMLCFATFYLIEAPAMRKVTFITKWLRK